MTPTPQPEKRLGGKIPRVLVVEDNPVMGQILGTLLTHMGLHYKTVPDGKEAVKTAEAARFDLILMDIMMPGMNGMKATRAIRSGSGPNAQTPILAVSGNADSMDVDACQKAGMNGHLKKPVGHYALKTAVKGFLDLPETDRTGEAGETEGKEASFIVAKDDVDILNWKAFHEYAALLKRKLPRLLADYLRAAPDLLSGINDALGEKDPKKLEFLAHKLKSTSLVFGAEGVSDLAAQLEALGRSGTTQGAQARLAELHIQYERTQAVLMKKLVVLRNAG
ncbi:response regulator [Kordiimonas marina]|uniref:response regulator n=1 Tax=Kordiimonas marina TaxID=2872312 RepID=UPI001FF3F093|nr:response regulator [Kordiimonas marina]MCJ9428707.1 response regulator [Kordiimonas marina]